MTWYVALAVAFHLALLLLCLWRPLLGFGLICLCWWCAAWDAALLNAPLRSFVAFLDGLAVALCGIYFHGLIRREADAR